jgi:restriction endonuclease Mrr
LFCRQAGTLPSEIVSKLRRIDRYEFERVCASILTALGATSRTTQRTKDGGIDFLGTSIKPVPSGLSVPAASKTAVVGQAKRYKAGNSISETQVREFVGAATLERHPLRRAAASEISFGVDLQV